MTSSFNEKKAEYQESINDVTSEREYEYANEGMIDIDRTHAGSTKLAYFNIVCVVAGTGTLGLPLALKQGGWLGILILFLSWSMSIYTGIILVRCLYANGKARLTTYKEVATSAFGWIGGWLTFFFNAWILLGAPILYMVLSGKNLNQLCANTAGEIGDTPWIIISCVIVAIPFIMVKTMKEVAWMSAFGALATLVVVIIVLVMSIVDKPNQTDIKHDAVVWEMFPIALSTISFSFGGNVVYPHVEASMKNPRDWPKAVGFGLSTCAAMYFITAISGYLIYGTKVASPIYNSIPAGVPQIVAIVVITLHVDGRPHPHHFFLS
jgi:amino acid permease